MVVMSQLHSHHPQPHPQHSFCCKNTNRAEVEKQLGVLAQACEIWPIRDYFKEKDLKETGIWSEGE